MENDLKTLQKYLAIWASQNSSKNVLRCVALNNIRVLKIVFAL